MIGLVWNCRDIGQASTVRSLKLLLKSHRPVFIFLSEVKCCNLVKVQKLIKSIHFDQFEFVPSKGKAGGLLLAWKNSINIKTIITTDNYINSLVFVNSTDVPWQLTVVYGSPVPHQRQLFWDDLSTIGNSFAGAWLVIGDFNVVLSSADKIGGRPVASSSSGGFQKMINDKGLIDLGFEGHAYTWSNKRSGLANIQERLDRGFANDIWKMRFPNAAITHLSALHSDHKPLLLQLHSQPDHLPRPFKFETMWTTHLDTAYVIQEAWNRQIQFESRLKNTKSALKQ